MWATKQKLGCLYNIHSSFHSWLKADINETKLKLCAIHNHAFSVGLYVYIFLLSNYSVYSFIERAHFMYIA